METALSREGWPHCTANGPCSVAAARHLHDGDELNTLGLEYFLVASVDDTPQHLEARGTRLRLQARAIQNRECTRCRAQYGQVRRGCQGPGAIGTSVRAAACMRHARQLQAMQQCGEREAGHSGGGAKMQAARNGEDPSAGGEVGRSPG